MHWIPSHFTMAFTYPHTTPGLRDASCDLPGMKSETNTVSAEAAFLLTFCSLWRGRRELGGDFRQSVVMNCSHHFARRWNWETTLLYEGTWLWFPREGNKPASGWTQLDVSVPGESIWIVWCTGNTYPLPCPSRLEPPYTLEQQERRLLVFSVSWGSLNCLTMHPTCTGTICHLSLLPPHPSPLPALLPAPVIFSAEPEGQVH